MEEEGELSSSPAGQQTSKHVSYRGKKAAGVNCADNCCTVCCGNLHVFSYVIISLPFNVSSWYCACAKAAP